MFLVQALILVGSKISHTCMIMYIAICDILFDLEKLKS